MLTASAIAHHHEQVVALGKEAAHYRQANEVAAELISAQHLMLALLLTWASTGWLTARPADDTVRARTTSPPTAADRQDGAAEGQEGIHA